MKSGSSRAERFFKTAWFARASRKARISDDELCAAVRQAQLGQADDLGGGVFKKRLNKNLHRSIILARGGRYWVYTFLYAKQARANIDQAELAAFRAQAALYALKTDVDIHEELQRNAIMEICNG